MAACLAVERTLGRQRGAGDRRDAARPIDLDILLYGSRVLGEAGLIIPHPRMHLRRFVLEPLAEIAPEARHPGLGRSVAELMAACPDRSWVKPFARPEEWLVEVTPRFR
jgi:2-amino-4-hydroxy-6-hydroxymethyldihydropteridine diphosphokinase